MFHYDIVTEPAEEPVTTSEAKSHLRIDIADDDTLISGYITAARLMVEDAMRVKLITQTWDFLLDKWPGSGCIKLPYPPLQSVTSIKYYDEDDTEYTFSTSSYRVSTKSFPGRIVLRDSAAWPSTTLREVEGIAIRAVVGYGSASAIDERVKNCIKLLVGEMYENRENTVIAQGVTISELPNNYKKILFTLKNFGF